MNDTPQPETDAPVSERYRASAPENTPPAPPAPLTSYIIPAHNEAGFITDTLEHLRAAAEALGRPYEIIVVNDDSTDATAELAGRGGARVVSVSLRQISAVRNAGARAAEGDRFVFIDADTRVNTGLLRAAAHALDAHALGGGARVTFTGDFQLNAAIALWFWNTLGRTLRWAAGCFVFVRRDAFEAVGGFDERFFAAEEIVLSDALKRLGPWTVLSDVVETSPRKVTTEMINKQWAILFRTIFSGGKALHRREGLDVWYEPGAQARDRG
ncbi:MAG: glycosyltransferase [Planctomycetota bacterium]|jgi:glycosyltransferase involved in cell wall biosynthesis